MKQKRTMGLDNYDNNDASDCISVGNSNKEKIETNSEIHSLSS